MDEAKAAPFCVGMVASSGGIDALTRILAPLPPEFPAAIVIVLHIDRNRPSLLAQILDRKTELGVRQAQGGELLTPGAVFVAPPDHHLEVCANRTLRLTDAPPVNHSRPSGNPLFLSLAEHYGEKAVAVVLTGYDGDGAEGLLRVRKAGGATLVQDEATSQQFSMPRTAIATGAVEQILDIDAIAAAIRVLVSSEKPSDIL